MQPGFNLAISRPAGQQGTIYYSLDGNDPRVPGTGGISPTPMIYNGEVSIRDYSVVKARILSGQNWSALNEAVFQLPPVYDDLRISEIMYNPPGGQDLEFIELENSGELTIDLSGLSFSNGIDYTFSEGTVLSPGEFHLLVTNESAFLGAFPDAPVRGEYADSLSNGGEKVTLKDRENLTIVSVDYDDEDFWPLSADGYGRSLVIADAGGDPDRPLTWSCLLYTSDAADE